MGSLIKQLPVLTSIIGLKLKMRAIFPSPTLVKVKSSGSLLQTVPLMNKLKKIRKKLKKTKNRTSKSRTKS